MANDGFEAQSDSIPIFIRMQLENLEGSVRSRSRDGAAGTYARPHRSRIERSRGLFWRYGESCHGVLARPL